MRPKGLKNDDFYLRPLQKARDDCWYTCQPIGRNKLSGVVANLAKKAGISGKITNQSCRATAASRLCNENVDEQLICEVTGHRSNVVHGYKRTYDNQLKSVSSVLYGNKEENTPIVAGDVPDKKPKVEVEVLSDLQHKICMNVNVNFK